jgi:hypothetical protein
LRKHFGLLRCGAWLTPQQLQLLMLLLQQLQAQIWLLQLMLVLHLLQLLALLQQLLLVLQLLLTMQRLQCRTPPVLRPPLGLPQ